MDRQQLVDLITKSDAKLEHLKSIDYDGLKEKITELESVFSEFKEGGERLLLGRQRATNWHRGSSKGRQVFIPKLLILQRRERSAQGIYPHDCRLDHYRVCREEHV